MIWIIMVGTRAIIAFTNERATRDFLSRAYPENADGSVRVLRKEPPITLADAEDVTHEFYQISREEKAGGDEKVQGGRPRTRGGEGLRVRGQAGDSDGHR